MSPAAFVTFAREKAITLPPELEALAQPEGASNGSELHQAQTKIAALTAEVGTLTKRVEELRTEGRPSAATRKISTLRLILLGLGKHKYRFDGNAPRSSAAGKIAADVTSAGYQVSEDTVLNHLREGWEEHGEGD
jgi:hypothetical protein